MKLAPLAFALVVASCVTATLAACGVANDSTPEPTSGASPTENGSTTDANAAAETSAPKPPADATADAEKSEKKDATPDALVDVNVAGGFCGALAQRAATCNEAFVASKCVTDEQCIQALIRPTSIPTLESCIATRPCGTTQDACDAAEAQAHKLDPNFVSYKSACKAAVSQCTDASVALPYWCDDGLAEYKPSALDELKKCFSGPCNLVTKCLSATVKTLGCNG